jgi:MOSC domain-containing protein YiiM
MQPATVMQVISVNVGQPREVVWNGQIEETGMYKEAVKGQVAVRKLNLEGDLQADLTVHGGLDKAVYAYPAEHYSFWREQFPEMELPWGMFGENLTITGLLEDAVQIGEHQVTVADIVRLYREDKYNLDLIRRVVAEEALPEEWREYFQERFERITRTRL